MKKIIAYLKEYNWEVAIWLLTLTCIIVLMLSVFSGCKPSEKTQRSRALQFYGEHPGEFAKNCADAFPVKDSIGEEIIDSIRMADNINLAEWLGTLYNDLDSIKDKFAADTSALARRYTNQINLLVARVSEVNKQYKPCQPEIIYKSKPVYQENVARVKALGAQIDSFWQDGIKCKEREKEALKRAENAERTAKERFIGLIMAVLALIACIILYLKRIL